MNERLFFEPSLTQTSKQIEINDVECHHIIKVLRSKIGDQIEILNGKGIHAHGEIVSISKKTVQVKISSSKFIEPPDYRITLGFSPVKKQDKNEWIIEKATELGIDTILPFQSKHSERSDIKLERINKICISALKQSQNPYAPKISELQKFKALIDKFENLNQTKLIAYCNTSDKDFIHQDLLKSKEILVLIGPEGGFAKEEVDYAIGKGFAPINLGKNRLRTETAAIFAISAIKTLIH